MFNSFQYLHNEKKPAAGKNFWKILGSIFQKFDVLFENLHEFNDSLTLFNSFQYLHNEKKPAIGKKILKILGSFFSKIWCFFVNLCKFNDFLTLFNSFLMVFNTSTMKKSLLQVKNFGKFWGPFFKNLMVFWKIA